MNTKKLIIEVPGDIRPYGILCWDRTTKKITVVEMDKAVEAVEVDRDITCLLYTSDAADE